MFNRFFVSLGFISCLSLSGCGLFEPRSPANEDGRTVLLVLSTAATIADQVCAGYALEHEDVQLAHDCALAYANVSQKLVLAETMLNNKDKQFLCGIKAVELGLEDFATLLENKTGHVPDAVKYAEMVARAVSSSCQE